MSMTTIAKRGSRLIILAWLVLVSVSQLARAQSGKELLAEGDKLADQAKYTEALTRYKEAYEKILPGLRGLEFKHTVEPQFMERTDLQAHMKQLFHEDTSDD